MCAPGVPSPVAAVRTSTGDVALAWTRTGARTSVTKMRANLMGRRALPGVATVCHWGLRRRTRRAHSARAALATLRERAGSTPLRNAAADVHQGFVTPRFAAPA